ncbi:hypothetical protein LOAG_07647 [Loa loa]|uniref:Uncharacterized protein n=1 Tax=Loa loa TaxID=7209 RepID=A0A1S0TVB7_LOALO|nr:hypothetical protein LOAG_07647 [Loa loa]EFO20840.1 hypothetical protein LOAG_07647 [Loa loa]
MENMRNYINALIIAIIICIGLAITIPVLCLCICLIRFCYIARKQTKPETMKYSREIIQAISSAHLSNSMNNLKSKIATPVIDPTTTFIDLSKNGQQITKQQLNQLRNEQELKSNDFSVTGDISKI